MCGMINLSLGSASAQWAVTAPIFVPMLMLIGYSPEVIQAAYRIGDSTTNIITPMMSYFGLILAWATRYIKNFGVGTLIAMMLPYTIFFMTGCGRCCLLLWTFGLACRWGRDRPRTTLPDNDSAGTDANAGWSASVALMVCEFLQRRSLRAGLRIPAHPLAVGRSARARPFGALGRC